MKYFFLDLTNLPAGEAWQLAGPQHVGALALMACLLALLCAGYRRAPVHSRKRWRQTVACANVGLELLKDGALAAGGGFDIGYLPLHLCGMAIFVCLWDAFSPSDASRQILYALCLPGAVGALLFPNWTVFPPDNFRFWHGFLCHILIVGYVLMQIFAKDWRPSPRSGWKCAAFLLVVVPPVYLLDRVCHLNYMFVNWPSPGSPLEWFADWLGNPGYLLPYAALIGGICALMYLPYLCADRSDRKIRHRAQR